ncbi:PepSY domain-containing protein [Brevundimonas sp.]|uniref:PepSY domain-containing protein n=1 Tax=Brevundimonas sp. TaxID=1871086 RepID=UPI002737BEF1|nr:PepSY domain-containing protein [Brevundimonas sp.]MDP3801914.1 PepSY domain-containing protein [Brevundimonas sp.]
MQMLRLSTQLHKWIALVVGLQVLFWVGGGLVMTAIPIETVRSEHRVAEQPPVPLALAALPPLDDIARQAGVAPAQAELRNTPRGPAWTLKPASGEPIVVSALTGRPFGPLSAVEASAFARRAYRGTAEVSGVAFLREAPEETGRTGPLWRVDFADREKTSFYLSPATAEVVTRRSGVWRLFDFFWRLHVMDWNDGEDFNHPLIIITTALTLSIVVSGFILLWIRLARDLKTLRAARRVARSE